MSHKLVKPLNKSGFTPFTNPHPSEKEILVANITYDVMNRVNNEIIPHVKADAEAAGWLEGEQYSNFQNALTFLHVLHTKYGFTADQCVDVINQSNSLVTSINNNQLKLHTLMEDLTDAVYFDKADIALAKKYSTY